VHVYERRWPKRWFRSPDLIRDLSGASSEFDVLHLHGVWTYVQQAASRLSRKFDIPCIITPHGVLESWRVHHKGFKKNLYLSLLGKRMLRSAACLHAITPTEVDGLRRAGYDGPVTVIPNGVDIPDYNVMALREAADGVWPVLRKRRVVLFLSRISPEKGLDQFLPAFRDVTRKETYGDVILVLAGSGSKPYAAKIDKWVQKLGIGKHIITPGFVGGRQKAMLMSRADVYTLPSYSEGFSVSVLENLAVGTPALITEGCNFPEVMQVGAGLCCRTTRDDLAQGLRHLLDMPRKETEVMSRRAKQLVISRYAWPVVIRKFLTVYDCILSGKAIPLHPEPKVIGSVRV